MKTFREYLNEAKIKDKFELSDDDVSKIKRVMMAMDEPMSPAIASSLKRDVAKLQKQYGMTFKEMHKLVNEAKLKPGDGVKTSDGSDGIIHSVLKTTRDMAVVITGWDFFGDKNESSRPNTSIEDISDLTPKKVNQKYHIYYEKSKKMKL